MPGFLSRIFGGGAATQTEYAALVADPAALFCAERVPMTGRAQKLHSPTRIASKSITSHFGYVVVFADKLVVLVGHRLRCHATYVTDPQTPVLISFVGSGIRIQLDAQMAFPPKGKGGVELDIRTSIPQSVLAQLTSHQLHASVPEADLISMCRWI